jgi:hypothetical protein
MKIAAIAAIAEIEDIEQLFLMRNLKELVVLELIFNC